MPPKISLLKARLQARSPVLISFVRSVDDDINCAEDVRDQACRARHVGAAQQNCRISPGSFNCFAAIDFIFSKFSACVNQTFHKEFQVYPLWLCPFKVRPPTDRRIRPFMRPNKDSDDQMFVDIGAYGNPKVHSLHFSLFACFAFCLFVPASRLFLSDFWLQSRADNAAGGSIRAENQRVCLPIASSFF